MIAKKVVRKETVIVLCGLRVELVELFGRGRRRRLQELVVVTDCWKESYAPPGRCLLRTSSSPVRAVAAPDIHSLLHQSLRQNLPHHELTFHSHRKVGRVPFLYQFFQSECFWVLVWPCWRSWGDQHDQHHNILIGIWLKRHELPPKTLLSGQEMRFSILIFDYCRSGPFNIFSFIATNIVWSHIGKIESCQFLQKIRLSRQEVASLSFSLEASGIATWRDHNSIEACLGQYVGRTKWVDGLFLLWPEMGRLPFHQSQKWVDCLFLIWPEMSWLRNSGQTMQPRVGVES